MRTSVELPDELLADVLALSGGATPSDAVVIALEDYVRQQRIAKVLAAMGTLDLDVDVHALRERDRRPSGG